MVEGQVTRVLVVDDRLEMAEMIADHLNEHGYEAIAMSSGQAALQILRTQCVDVLVTDLRMPGIDGFDLPERVRRARSVAHRHRDDGLRHSRHGPRSDAARSFSAPSPSRSGSTRSFASWSTLG